MECYSLLLGIATIGLFERLARWEQEDPRLWSIGAGVLYFGLALAFGTFWAILGTAALTAGFVARVLMRKPPKGLGPR
jgi:hypothetical protein